jgi:hypothetical protein
VKSRTRAPNKAASSHGHSRCVFCDERDWSCHQAGVGLRSP